MGGYENKILKSPRSMNIKYDEALKPQTYIFKKDRRPKAFNTDEFDEDDDSTFHMYSPK